MESDYSLVEALLYEEEGVSLDFKVDQYRFARARDDEKSELLKDILAFANAWRRSDAYILIGVRDVKGGRSEAVGVSEPLDDAQLQQFVNSKTQRPVTLSYRNIGFEDKTIGLLHIPLQQRPIYLKADFGKLKKNTVYIRRGSSTDVATPDKIARMGILPTEPFQTPKLQIFFADKEQRTLLPESLVLSSLVLSTPRPEDIPDYRKDHDRYPSIYRLGESEVSNPDYYRQLTKFIKIAKLVSPVHFAVKNTGNATAHDVRLEIFIRDPNHLFFVLDAYSYPEVPSIYGLYKMPSVALPHDVWAKKITDYWLVQSTVGKVQPKSTIWLDSPLYLGAVKTCDLELEITIFSDNLPQPEELRLHRHVEAQRQSADLNRILEFERERRTGRERDLRP